MFCISEHSFDKTKKTLSARPSWERRSSAFKSLPLIVTVSCTCRTQDGTIGMSRTYARIVRRGKSIFIIESFAFSDMPKCAQLKWQAQNERETCLLQKRANNKSFGTRTSPKIQTIAKLTYPGESMRAHCSFLQLISNVTYINVSDGRAVTVYFLASCLTAAYSTHWRTFELHRADGSMCVWVCVCAAFAVNERRSLSTSRS